MRKRLRSVIVANGLLALLGTVAAGGAGPALAVAGARIPAMAPSPGKTSALTAVAAVAPGNAWAVGYYCPSHCSSSPAPQRFMILHWNGSAWSLKLNGSSGSLQSVSAAKANDVWAVGASPRGPMFLHWNGRAWSRARAASLPPASGLASVSTVSARSAWAVGSAYSIRLGAYVTLVTHWNGSKWSHVPAPPLAGRGGGAGLSAVSADSAKDAWAAGNYCASGCRTRRPVERGAILHWNGTKWSRSALPVSTAFNFFAVRALSRSNAWALGQTFTGSRAFPLMLHWNGSKWLKVAIPNIFASAMAFVSPSDGWAAGLGQPPMHWNGTAWKAGTRALPNWAGFITGASGDAPNDVWITGDHCTSSCLGGVPVQHGFLLHWNGSKWSVF